MSSNVETLSMTSSETQSRNEQSMDPSNRGSQQNRPRRRYQGKSYVLESILTSDRQRQPGAGPSQQRTTTAQPPQKLLDLTTHTSELASETSGGAAEDMDSEELCFICGTSMKERYFSLSPCNNAFCHNCSLRLRALYKSTNCPFCKVTSSVF
jgi:hypothetical protein